jgi:hypothetical protein
MTTGEYKLNKVHNPEVGGSTPPYATKKCFLIPEQTNPVIVRLIGGYVHLPLGNCVS